MPNRHTPVKSAYDLVRAILKLHPDIRVNQGARMIEVYVQDRRAEMKPKPEKPIASKP